VDEAKGRAAAIAAGPKAITASFDVLQLILSDLAPITLEAGETLVRQGDESDVAYYLQTGELLVYLDTRYGEVPLRTVGAPGLVGEIGAVAGIARTASVKAAAPSQVLRIERDRLLELGHRSPEFLVGLVRQLGRQFDAVNKAVALYTNALEALEQREVDSALLAELTNSAPQLSEFSTAFRRLADHIVSNRRRHDELASAALIQRSFLPNDSTVDLGEGAVEIRARMRPAREVGGDFYDFFPLDEERMIIAIGDVCGKGMPSSLFMAVAVTVLRMAAREEADVASAIARANALLCRDNIASLFATCFFAVLDLRRGVLEYCNCGHNAPIHLLASGEIRRLEATGVPLAMLEDRSASVACVKFGPGDDLILFSDGVTEAINPADEEFGEELLLETLVRHREKETEELIATVFSAVDDFARGAAQADDITCVAVRRRLPVEAIPV
jgi:sigma-B regulation protein RsbU (phosphoserine phosphatase)